MAVAELSRSTTRGWHRLPVALRVAIVYLLARAVTTVFFALAAQLSTATSRYGERPGVGALLMGWDAQWYWYIAVHGYPTTLPLDDSGQITQNQWAFMPVYPYLARLLGGTGVSWQVAAILISLAAGYAACLVLHSLLRKRVGTTAAMWAVLFFANAPLAAMFQVAYAESLFLLLLFGALWLVDRRHYAWLYPVVLLMAFTRPGVLAFALFLGLHGVVRWVRRTREPLRVGQIVHIGLNGLLGALAGLSWPMIAGVVTGRADAYFATESSWRRGWLAEDDGSFVPFRAFWDAAGFWFTQWGLGATVGHVALIVVVVAIAALLLFGPRVRRLGSDVRLWSASYLLYLFAVFFPQSSVFRLLLPLSPLWGAAAVPRSRVWRCGVVVACLVGQWWWIYNMYALGNTYWQIP
ncbi:hypothetical protein PU630_09600 [Microbacterium horticulturae]|uniref:Mannosyltransferase (PIG-V) n=1 Tax=Microbacterium horticulturae TaxID=3028316 RepID=A0ABY8BVG9_9MICO|nr:hypothetical protein [Microbacterium sp. KACC 23027]WEG07517.1 hypothetical protein PU630_09600 [Microbacterium sp. KACC 23027]